MTDREKAIKGLEMHATGMCNVLNENGKEYCPYWASNDNCMIDLLNDALALLKEQDPVKPIRLENWWKCPSCSGNIVANMNYCPRCGKAVKWE